MTHDRSNYTLVELRKPVREMTDEEIDQIGRILYRELTHGPRQPLRRESATRGR